MTRQEIANDIKRFTGSAMVTGKELADYMGIKKTQWVRDHYLVGLEKVGNRYWVNDIAGRLKDACEIGGG